MELDQWGDVGSAGHCSWIAERVALVDWVTLQWAARPRRAHRVAPTTCLTPNSSTKAATPSPFFTMPSDRTSSMRLMPCWHGGASTHTRRCSAASCAALSASTTFAAASDSLRRLRSVRHRRSDCPYGCHCRWWGGGHRTLLAGKCVRQAGSLRSARAPSCRQTDRPNRHTRQAAQPHSSAAPSARTATPRAAGRPRS
jgi:hypothetical protein